MDKHKAHDLLHTKSSECSFCKGEIDEAKLIALAEEKSKPQIKNVPFRPFVELMQFAEGKGKLPEVIKLIPVGKYNTDQYGEVDIKKSDIQEMAKHFNENVRAASSTAGLPIDIEHGSSQYGEAAAGWIKDIDVRDDGGYGKIDWTQLGKNLLNDGIYKFYSPAFQFDYKDPQYKDLHLSNVMTGGGLTNKPMIKDHLPPLVMSEKNLTEQGTTNMLSMELVRVKPIMKLSEIILKEKTARTTEEIAFVESHKDELTFAEYKKEGFLEVKAVDKKGIIEMSENEVKELKEAAALGVLAHKELEKATITKEVEAYVFSEKGGKIAPKNVEPIVDLMLSLTEDGKKKLKAIIEELPEQKLFGERGSSAAATTGHKTKLLMEEVSKIRKENKDISFKEATDIAIRSNPDLLGYQEEREVAVTPR